MTTTYLNKLKTIDTDKLSFLISDKLMDNATTDNINIKGISIAYVLYQASIDNKVCIDSLKTFDDSFQKEPEIKEIVLNHISKVWDIVTSLRGICSADELLSYILFNNEVSKYSFFMPTPSGVSKLACSILDIENGDNVEDLCSGTSNFYIEALTQHQNFKYTGIEINYICNDIAKIRASLLDEDVSLILCDALEYKAPEKANKIFSNYPFMAKSIVLNDHKEDLVKSLGIPKDAIKRASSDWVFNATIVEQLAVGGKAVAIMTNASTWNTADKHIRQFFIENGYIETIISLPSRLFNGTNIPSTLIVFSHNNDKVKLINASNICTKKHIYNILTDSNVTEIISLLGNDGEKSVTKSVSELSDNDYILNPERYLETVPEVKNGVKFNSVIKSITRGLQIKASEFDKLKSEKASEYKYLTLANIHDGLLSLTDDQYLTNIPDKMEKYIVKNNSIILSKTGSPVKSAVVEINNNEKLLASGNLFIIEIDEKKANPYYIQAFFASDIGKATFKSIVSGGLLPTFSIDSLKNMFVPLPPIDEQSKIASKYAALVDKSILLKRQLENTRLEMCHVFDEEE